MAASPKTRASFSLRALLGLGENAQLESRVLSLTSPAPAAEGREGTPCTQCGFGRMFPAPIGENGAVRLLCERRGCRFTCDRPAADTPTTDHSATDNRGTPRGHAMLAV